MKARINILTLMIMISIWFGNEKVFSNQVIGGNDTLIIVNFTASNMDRTPNKVTILNFIEENTFWVKIDTTRDDFIVISEKTCFNVNKTSEKELELKCSSQAQKMSGEWKSNLICFDPAGENKFPLQYFQN